MLWPKTHLCLGLAAREGLSKHFSFVTLNWRGWIVSSYLAITNFNACCQPTCLLPNLLQFSLNVLGHPLKQRWHQPTWQFQPLEFQAKGFIPALLDHGLDYTDDSTVPLVTTSNRKWLQRLQGCGCVGNQRDKTWPKAVLFNMPLCHQAAKKSSWCRHLVSDDFEVANATRRRLPIDACMTLWHELGILAVPLASTKNLAVNDLDTVKVIHMAGGGALSNVRFQGAETTFT